jgi:hypothetical protein
MTTVAEIKAAIEKLSALEREQLESQLWPDWDRAEGDCPPGAREKLDQAARGRFQPGNRSGIKKLRSSLE